MLAEDGSQDLYKEEDGESDMVRFTEFVAHYTGRTDACPFPSTELILLARFIFCTR